MINEKKFIKTQKKCYCQTPELIENYEQAINDATQVWHCHHRDEIRTLPSGMVVIRTRKELIENGRYYNCPPNELIFLTKEEHSRIHMVLNKGKKFSSEHKRKISEALIGNTYGKGNTNTRGKPRSEFGKKFKEHFGITYYENPNLYNKEYLWYRRHNKKCKWEV